MKCWLAGLPGAGPCDGPLIRAHLIPQNLIRRTFPRGAWALQRRGIPFSWVALADAPLWGAQAPQDASGDALTVVHRSTDALCADPRSWVLCCGGTSGLQGHHGRLDQPGGLQVARRLIPPETEELAAELGLGWYMNRAYGPVT